jgi:hypothetical protein
MTALAIHRPRLRIVRTNEDRSVDVWARCKSQLRTPFKLLRRVVDETVRLVTDTRDEVCNAVELIEYALSPEHLRQHNTLPIPYLLRDLEGKHPEELVAPSEGGSSLSERVYEILGLQIRETPSSPVDDVEEHDVFLSFRIKEANVHAASLQQALRQRGVKVYRADVADGDSAGQEVSKHIVHSRLIVILGTENYGEETSISYSTFNELSYVVSCKRPKFIIKMCHEFQQHLAIFNIQGQSLIEASWMPRCDDEKPPTEVVDRIVAKLGAIPRPPIVLEQDRHWQTTAL